RVRLFVEWSAESRLKSGRHILPRSTISTAHMIPAVTGTRLQLHSDPGGPQPILLRPRCFVRLPHRHLQASSPVALTLVGPKSCHIPMQPREECGSVPRLVPLPL